MVSRRSSSTVSCRAVIVRMSALSATSNPPAATATTTAMMMATQSVVLIGLVLSLPHTFGDLPLGAVVGRFVIGPALDLWGPVRLRHPPAWIVVRIVVPLAVAELSGRVVGGIAEMLGDGAGGAVPDLGLAPPHPQGRTGR